MDRGEARGREVGSQLADQRVERALLGQVDVVRARGRAGLEHGDVRGAVRAGAVHDDLVSSEGLHAGLRVECVEADAGRAERGGERAGPGPVAAGQRQREPSRGEQPRDVSPERPVGAEDEDAAAQRIRSTSVVAPASFTSCTRMPAA